MLPFAVARVVVRELFEEFHVGGQSDAGVCSFDEVVTQQPLLREAPVVRAAAMAGDAGAQPDACALS